MEIIAQLFFTFLKIGTLSFGGGYAMIPFIQQEAVANGWLTVQQFANIVAISQVTPGVLAVNMAAYVGYSQAGTMGALSATLGACLPSFIIITIILKFFSKFADRQMTKYIFSGLRPAALGLIIGSAIILAWSVFFPGMEGVSLKINDVNFRGILIFAITFLSLYKFKISPIIAILSSAIIGIVVF